MDSPSGLSAGGSETRKPVEAAESDPLLDINKNPKVPAYQSTSSKQNVVDIEAINPNPEVDTTPTSNTPQAPTISKESHASRIIPIDNIRAVALSLILLQNTAIQAVATHPHAAQIHTTQPASYTLISIFVGMTRLLAVPLLFFTAGFSSNFSMTKHGRSPIRFALRRTWKTALTVVLYQSVAYLAKLAHPLPPAETPWRTPYYATREGVLAVLNGPTAYILAVLALDYIYSLLHTPTDPISSPNTLTIARYVDIKFTLILFLYFWVFACGLRLTDKIFPWDSVAYHWIYVANAAAIHFPFLYLIAYIAGIHFDHYYKYILAAAQRTGASPPMKIFLTTLTTSTILLYALSYPVDWVPFFDVRLRPALSFQWQDGTVVFYPIWVFGVLLTLPEAVIAAFFTHPALSADWGVFSRTAHVQVYVQMLYIVGFSERLRFFDSVLIRWLLPSYMAIMFTWYASICVNALGNSVKRGWCAVRSCICRKAERAISV